MRTMPHNQTAEAALLGCCLIRPELVDELDVDEQDFFVPRHGAVWRALLAVRAQGLAVDEVTLGAELERFGSLESVGGYAALSKLTEVADGGVVTADNAPYHAAIVKRLARARRLMVGLSEAIEAGYAEKDPDEIWSRAERTLREVDAAAPDEALTARDLIKRRMAEYDAIAEARQHGGVALTGVPTGMDKLDELLGGIQPGIVTIVAGRPGMGKSSFALSVTNAASAHGHGVHVFSLEDSRQAYTDRMIGGAARVPIEKLRAASLSIGEMSGIGPAVGALVQRRNWLYHDVAGIGADEIVRAARRHRKSNGTRLVVVDYLQLVRRPRRYESVHDALSQNISTLADAAKRDDMAYLVLSQLSRDIERRQDKRPQLSDLRESGSIEERSKCVLGLYRGSYYGPPVKGIDYGDDEQPPTDDDFRRRIDVIVMKNNQGQTGVVRCRWDGPTTRVY